MRVLMDNGTPRGVARALIGHVVEEARSRGWDAARGMALALHDTRRALVAAYVPAAMASRADPIEELRNQERSRVRGLSPSGTRRSDTKATRRCSGGRTREHFPEEAEARAPRALALPAQRAKRCRRPSLSRVNRIPLLGPGILSDRAPSASQRATADTLIWQRTP